MITPTYNVEPIPGATTPPQTTGPSMQSPSFMELMELERQRRAAAAAQQPSGGGMGGIGGLASLMGGGAAAAGGGAAALGPAGAAGASSGGVAGSMGAYSGAMGGGAAAPAAPAAPAAGGGGIGAAVALPIAASAGAMWKAGDQDLWNGGGRLDQPVIKNLPYIRGLRAGGQFARNPTEFVTDAYKGAGRGYEYLANKGYDGVQSIGKSIAKDPSLGFTGMLGKLGSGIGGKFGDIFKGIF